MQLMLTCSIFYILHHTLKTDFFIWNFLVLFSIFYTPAQQVFSVLVRHVVTKHRSDLLLSPNLQVRSNVILSRVGAILLVSCTLQTRALVHTPRRNSAKKDLFGVEVDNNCIQFNRFGHVCNPLCMVVFIENTLTHNFSDKYQTK